MYYAILSSWALERKEHDMTPQQFAAAHDRYLTPPDDEPDTTCEECEGKGTIPDPTSDIGDTIPCVNCKGHGNMDAIIAENEIEAQIARYESLRDDSEGHDL